MKLINDQLAVVRADWLEAAVEAPGSEDVEELRDEHVRVVEEVLRRRKPMIVPLRRIALLAVTGVSLYLGRPPASGGSRAHSSVGTRGSTPNSLRCSS